MIKRFDKIEGKCIDRIDGQNRYGYSKSDFVDMYDLIEFSKHEGYQGNELVFYDFETGMVYKPFDKKRNVAYGNPMYLNKFLYFLRADYNSQKVILYRYLPEIVLEEVVELEISEIDLYNLAIVGDQPHIISQGSDDGFRCYYPIKIAFPLDETESVVLIENDKVYIEKWIEEGWDDENNCATDQYKYYNEIIVKDFAGKTIEKHIGCLNKSSTGDWWIS